MNFVSLTVQGPVDLWVSTHSEESKIFSTENLVPGDNVFESFQGLGRRVDTYTWDTFVPWDWGSGSNTMKISGSACLWEVQGHMISSRLWITIVC